MKDILKYIFTGSIAIIIFAILTNVSDVKGNTNVTTGNTYSTCKEVSPAVTRYIDTIPYERGVTTMGYRIVVVYVHKNSGYVSSVILDH